MSTTHQPSGFQPQGPGAYTTGGAPQPPAPGPNAPRSRNTLAIVAFVAAVAGFVFAVWEGAYLLGWILLPLAFLLAIIALFLRDKPRKMAVWALVISVIGTVAGGIAFMGSAVQAIDDAVGSTEPSVVAADPVETEDPVVDEAPADEPEPEEAVAEDPPAEEPGSSDLGTRDQPLPLGSSIATDEWQVTVNSFTADATAAVLAENQFNDPPADGHAYALANVTVTRVGADSGHTMLVSVDYITAGGNVLHSYDAMAVAPDSLGLEELFEGASVTGNVVFAIPAGDAGVLRVEPGMFTDEAFFATS